MCYKLMNLAHVIAFTITTPSWCDSFSLEMLLLEQQKRGVMQDLE